MHHPLDRQLPCLPQGAAERVGVGSRREWFSLARILLSLPLPFIALVVVDEPEERALCVRDQHLAVLHHQRSRPREQYGGRPRQDRLHRHAGLDRRW